jgi:hypothetical protein
MVYDVTSKRTGHCNVAWLHFQRDRCVNTDTLPAFIVLQYPSMCPLLDTWTLVPKLYPLHHRHLHPCPEAISPPLQAPASLSWSYIPATTGTCILVLKLYPRHYRRLHPCPESISPPLQTPASLSRRYIPATTDTCILIPKLYPRH